MTGQKKSKAFDKVIAGLEEARAWLDGSADKRDYRVHEPVDSKDDAATTRPRQRSRDTT
jgi:hypothetical protein